ncbi:hypothetical protein K469DRAFT_762544 [Zopfia rhizophila CBS 207.26]|uniref:Cora-domain-containing protein n=1 Tax=Zopfia rhizophila CBS 207.26 TaxID=1314779 RepID=A0A6A6EFK6_9PEZI|nr:hypothetical protein K469DRAFT_762544 [Zopfia rhizophila CBS 207.26]
MNLKGSVPADNSRYGRLDDFDIEEWLQQKGKYSPPEPPNHDARLVGGIRLIISERVSYHPPSLSMSRESYLRIEEEFHLPPVSLLALSNESGLCSRFEEYDEKEPSKLKRIVKTPQKFQVGNYGLTLSYDFTTGFATGLLLGTGVIQGGADFSVWPKCPSAEIFDLIKAVPSLLAQPMLLPTILLQHHLYRTENFCNFYLGDSYTAILYRLGTNRAGRFHLAGPYEDPVGEKTIKETRVNLRNLTGDMSTFMTEIIWYCKVSDWHCEYVDFLVQTLDYVAGKMGTTNGHSHLSEYREIKECIEYLGSTARGLRRHTTGSRERAEADFGVLYSIIAQLDNRLNAKMSASSSRDSTAMKTLAFITTLFLPGTFVATVFSMNMFNWEASASDKSSSRVVSSYFWIYWVITVPLTVIVATSWRLWWNWEKRNFDRDVRIEIENIEEPMPLNSSKDSPKNQSEEGTGTRARANLTGRRVKM